MKEALLLYGATDFGAPQFSSDLLWRTRFRVPDPVFLVEIEGRTYLFVSALEFGRAKREARVDEAVLSDGEATQVMRFLKKQRVRRVIIPSPFPYGIAEALEGEFRIEVKERPFYPERMRKTKWETGEIRAAQGAAGRALKKAMAFLGVCRIRATRVCDGTKIVTSEMLRKLIDSSLFADGYLGINTIVSCGVRAADPHAIGSGPLRAHQPIVIDIFPVSLASHYYGDMTRTVFKGEPSKEFEKMYEAVREAQERVIAAVRPGIDGSRLYQDTIKFFEERGYPTMYANQPQGFIHGLGHGVGIDIHEPPNLGAGGWKLEAGNVVTVEPGLYYHRPRGGIPSGGIRIEDTVVVKNRGCENLTRFPKDLARAIIS